VTSANAPFTGSWKAGAPLSSLTADPADGTWVFKVADVVGSDRGSIRSVTLSIAGWV
jgi:subtilisin-like proprotein convertase family protein